MAVDGYLNFNTKVDTKGFNRGTKSVAGGLQNLKSSLASVGKAAAAAFSVAKLVQFGKQAVELASNIQEVQNVVDVAFGEETKGKMEAFADTAIETYGISKLTAKQTGSTFMATASGMGLAKDSASDMAVALTGLSADMASFYNVEQDVAATALKSVFTGETETLKQFGIVMTEANLKAFALQQGITKDISKMSQAEKVTLRYNYVMAQTALAQGDFARTSDGWANQTRMLSEKWKEFSSVVGQALMNTLLPAVRALNSLMSQLIDFANSAYQSLAKVFGWETQSAKTANGTAAAIAASVQNQDDLTEATKETSKAAQDNLQSFDKINKLSGDDEKASSSGVSTPTAGAYNVSGKVALDTKDAQKELSGFAKKVQDTFAKVKTYIEKNFSGIFKNFWSGLKDEGKELGEIFDNIFSDLENLAEPLKEYFEGDFTISLQTAFQTISNIALGLFDTFNTVFSGIWDAVYPMIEQFVNVGLPMITQFATESWQTLDTAFTDIKAIFDMLWKEAAEPALTFISNLWCDLVDTIAEAWNTWGKPIFDGIREAFDKTKDTLVNIWYNILKPVFDKVMDTLKYLWEEHIQPLVAEILDLVGTFITAATDIYNKFILPLVNWFVEVLGPPLSKVINGIIETGKNLVGNIVDAVRGIIEALKGVINFVAGVFTGDWDRAWQGIKQIFEGIWTALENVLRVPVNAIIGMVNRMLDAIEFAINGMINAINRISITVPDWVRNIGGNTYGFNLSNVTLPDIPYLAQGTVVPANYGEFLAVLGDNKRETEIVSPLGTIKKALAEVLAAQRGNGENINLTVYLDGNVVYKSVVKKNRENTIATGVNALAT